MTDSYLVPTWGRDRTISHIHENYEQHISRNNIHEVIHREIGQLEIARSAHHHQSDVIIRGKTLDGKQLHLCAIVERERKIRVIDELSEKPPRPASQLGSIIYNGWVIQASVSSKKSLMTLKKNINVFKKTHSAGKKSI